MICRAYQKNIDRTKLELDLKAQLLDQEADDKENSKNLKVESQESVRNKLSSYQSGKRPTVAMTANCAKQLTQKALKRNRSAHHVSRNKSSSTQARKKSAGATKKQILGMHLPKESAA